MTRPSAAMRAAMIAFAVHCEAGDEIILDFTAHPVGAGERSLAWPFRQREISAASWPGGRVFGLG